MARSRLLGGYVDASTSPRHALSAMRRAAARETTRIPRVAGLTGGHTALVTTRLFGAPHHIIYDMGLIGGA